MAATESITVTKTLDADPQEIWKLITDPVVSRSVYGAEVRTNWRRGQPITFSGEINGRKFSNKGRIRVIVPGKVLTFTQWNEASGLPDEPNNYATVTYELIPAEHGGAKLKIMQRNLCGDRPENVKRAWAAVLAGVYKTLTHH